MRRASIALLLFATGACATLGQAVFREPVVTYKDAMITGLGLTGGTVEVVLGVYNPNSFRLDGTRLTYRFLVDSVSFGDGELNQQFVVQESDSATLRLPLTFSYAGIGAAGRQLLQTGMLQYRIAGEITVQTPLGAFTRPYSGRGRLNTIR
jgi:LEA14-like dessication related protein